MAVSETMRAHLATGATTLCHCWALSRRDGLVMGFTDHDRPLSFEGIRFAADAGLTGRALVESTGLSLDNSEVAGALRHASITEADLAAGRYDGAGVRQWLVNWADPAQRVEQFRGTIGEIAWAGGRFHAELRGLTDALNQPVGRVYQAACSAVLGDGACKVDLDAPALSLETAAAAVTEARVFTIETGANIAPGWFEKGRLVVTSGSGEGLTGIVESDEVVEGGRRIALGQALRFGIVAGDGLRIEAGCDKSPRTCRKKFNNFHNFRGFPHIPGEDWLKSYPKSDAVNDGGSMNR